MKYDQSVVAGNDLQETCQYNEDNPYFMLMGRKKDGIPERIPVGEEMLSRHILLLGGIGTGKSNATNFFVHNIRSTLDEEDIMIIFDTKGDYYKKFYHKGDIVISNDDRACDENGPNFWNIFGEIAIDSRVEENIVEISKTLFDEKIKGSSQPFFPNAAMDLFGALLLHLIRNDECIDKRNNYSLRNLFNSFSVPAMKNILNQHPDLRAMCSYIEDDHAGQTLGVVSELQQLIREIFIGNFMKKGTISIRDLVKRKGGKVVFIEYDLGIGNMLTPVYKLLFDLAIKEALCRKTNEGNVFFLMDEFRLLPNLQHIDDGVNFGRSLGAKFIVGIQNIDQISAAYGENLAQSILSGFATTISFRVNDAHSREYVKQLYGHNIKLQKYLSTIQSRGISEQLRDSFVIEDSDIINLQVGEAIVGTMGCQPFQFKFNYYDL